VRLFAIKENGTLRVYFNPSLIRESSQFATEIEGCASIPDRRFLASRPRSVVARWQTPTGQTKAQQFHDWQARTYQHELDHLNGILLVDRGEEILEQPTSH
jgi:peptide deformylase